MRRISSRLCSEALEIVTPGELHRLELGDRRQRSDPSDVHRNLVDPGLGLLRLELVRDRPSRRARNLAQLLLERERVDLGDHAVGFVVELMALLGNLVLIFEDLVDAVADFRQRIHLEPQRLDALEKFPLALVADALDRARAYGKRCRAGARRVICGSSWRSDPAAALRGLANGGSPAATRSLLSRSNARRGRITSPRTSSSCGIRAVRRMDEAQRHALDRADVLGDVLAVDAVAARRADRQPAVFIDQFDREAVELDLGDVLDIGVVIQEALDAAGRTRASPRRPSRWRATASSGDGRRRRIFRSARRRRAGWANPA